MFQNALLSGVFRLSVFVILMQKEHDVNSFDYKEKNVPPLPALIH